MDNPVRIGEAELWLGDCTEILPTLGRASVDMIFTDPPYGHRNNDDDLIGKWEAALGRPSKNGADAPRPIANDGPEAEGIFRQFLSHAQALLRHGGCCCCCCCCGGGGPDPMFARWSLAMDEILEFKQMVVWDKGPMGMGWHYRRSYETVLVAQRRGGKCKWHAERNDIENIIRPGNGIRKIIPSAEQHPTEKPPGLAEHFIQLHSLAGEIILDPFMGSGTTGVACARLGRRFIGIEIEEKYFHMACRRIEQAYAQPRLFADPPAKPAQERLL